MTQSNTRKLTYADAIVEAQAEEMARDANVFVIGEDVDIEGGVYNLTVGIAERFGPKRCVGTPISEQGFMGLAVGAAMTGLRPVVEIMYLDFILLAVEQIVNQMAKLRFMSGGQVTMPVTIRAQAGVGTREAAQHSQSLESWFAHVPGIKVVMPATVYDAKGLLKSAIRDNNPVLVIENRILFYEEEVVPEGQWTVPLGVADVVRTGRDVTVAVCGYARRKALAAAAQLEGEVDVELIDLRSVVPLDMDTLLASVQKTGRLLIVHEAPVRCGIGAEVVRRVVAEGFDSLDTEPIVLGGRNIPIPFSPGLEDAAVPQEADIVRAVKDIVTR